MRKVLIVFPVSDVGGGENVLLNLVRFRERRDLDYSALIISDVNGPLSGKLDELNVPHVRIPRGRMRNPFALTRTIGAVRREIERIRPDVLLTNSSQGYLYGRWASGGRVRAALYFMSVPPVRHISLLDMLTWRRPPDALFAASNTIKQQAETRRIPNVRTVYHGVPEPVPAPHERDAVAHRLADWGVPAGAQIVLMPGRLQRWKGQLLFVQAFARVATMFPDAYGVIIGAALFGRDGEYQAEIEAEIGRLGLQRRLYLAGQQPIAPWLERATCVVHASLTPDAFPNVCIEALAARRPLITNIECGVAEILTHNVNAWVVAPRNVDELSGAVRDALSDPLRASRIAAAGYERYAASCTPLHMVRPIESALCAL